jgi:asparaginyl-tRNA synthetase
MSQVTSVAAALKGQIAVGKQLTVRGWIRSKRDSKAGISFLAIHDGSAFDPIQAVVPADLANYESEVLKISTGCAVVVSGELVESQGKGQSVEIHASEVQVLGWVDDAESYPIAKKRHSFEYLRSQAHLRPRTNTFGAITRVRTTLANAIHNFFHDQDFHWINTPIITGSDCEGAGELFRVSTLDYNNLPRSADGSVDFAQDFFAGDAFLTVSGQLEVESYCLAMSKVYTFGPTFRAENSNTSRHLAEFWMIEPEIAFCDLAGNMDLAEDFLKYVINYCLEKCEDDLVFLENRILEEEKNTKADLRQPHPLREKLKLVAENNFERVSYTEAYHILINSNLYLYHICLLIFQNNKVHPQDYFG